MKQKFIVTGMTCSACSLGIEKTLIKTEGVISASVSLMDESMVVEFDESKISAENICGVVAKLGYKAQIYGAKKEKNEKKRAAADVLKIRFLISLALLIPLMYFSMGKMAKFPLPSDGVNFAVQAVLTAVILAVNYKFFTVGTRAVWHRAPNMDTLVALGAAASFIFSIVETIMFYVGKIMPEYMFYESAAMVVTLVTLGKWLEDKSKRKTGREIEKLSKLLPDTALVLRGGKEERVSVGELAAGDKVLFRAGDYVSVDGEVYEGSAFVDKSAITGESIPEEITVGRKITTGSILKSGFLSVTAEKTGGDTLFAKIIEAVRSAGASKAPVQKFADKVAGVFVPVVTAIAVLTFVVWISVTKDVYLSFNYGISVLVISCPCALGLATPVAVMAATGKAASLGVLYKDAEALQKTDKINCAVLDKTATITVGQPKVVDVRYFYDDKALVLSVASAIEGKSNHPIAECVREYCGSSDKVAKDYEYVVGKGAKAKIDGVKYTLGNRALAEISDGGKIEKLEKELSEGGRTAVFLCGDGELLAVFAVADIIKEDSREAVAALTAMKVKSVMLTGDNEYAAKAVAAEAGVGEYVAGVMPEGKAAAVKKLMEEGYKVAMVGDGINDSPALKTADVGIAVGTGTDVAIDSADVVLTNGSLRSLADALSLGHKSAGIIKGNLFWAFFYNALAIPVAAGALSGVGVTLTPSIAAACMSLSSLFVVFNALRITAFKSRFGLQKDKDKKGEKNMVKNVIVEGMMCEHCVGRVKSALEKVENAQSVSVDLNKKTAKIEGENLSDEQIKKAVEDASYEVSSIK